VLLGREGWRVNHKRVDRLYREEGLSIRTKHWKKRMSLPQLFPPLAKRPQEQWSLDFLTDSLVDDRRFRILTIVDNVSRVSPAIVVGFSLKGVPVVAVLEQLKGTMGLRQRIAVDNGPEFISKALDAWTYRNRVMLASPRIMPTSSRSMGTSRRNVWISTGSRPWLRGGSSTTPSDPIGRWGSRRRLRPRVIGRCSTRQQTNPKSRPIWGAGQSSSAFFDSSPFSRSLLRL
jgi:putative transposase